ncbi:MAG TPA: DUF6092 family protein [Candidatus Dormibacteraeota bacterium]|nr:DUF6092 family protein [Candidatus Dormibacteraeota bacterium]
MSGSEARLERKAAYRLLAHLLASAEICAFEPGFYGTFRLLDAASRLAGALLEAGLDDPWLGRLRDDIEAKKVLLMSDREAYFAFLPEAARRMAERLREEGEEGG